MSLLNNMKPDKKENTLSYESIHKNVFERESIVMPKAAESQHGNR